MLGGYFGGRIDAFAVYLINVKLALPIICGAGGHLDYAQRRRRADRNPRFAHLGPLCARYASLTQQLREREFVLAAHSAGASDAFIIVRELLPNLLDAVIVLITLEVAALILIEAALSFVGLGVPPPTPSWGSMIADGRSLMFFKPYLVMIPVSRSSCSLWRSISPATAFATSRRAVTGASRRPSIGPPPARRSVRRISGAR